MKIAHLCLSNFYYDNFSYQENLLVRQNVKDEHDVLVLASVESVDNKGKVKFLSPNRYLGDDGALVIRLPYNAFIPRIIQHKFRSYSGVLSQINSFAPDVIYFHGLSAFELLNIKKYKLLNPKTKLILDCHSDKYNTATGFISKTILHNIFYKSIYKSILPFVDKVFCISVEAMDFAVDFYDTPKEKVEFYPLGGFCLDNDEYTTIRTNQRHQLALLDSNIMFLQTGKFNKKKKLIESLENFIKVKDPSFVYVVAGNLEPDIKEEALKLIGSDERINYIGWVDAEKIQSLLCASDIYVQPGSQSATMQQSLCLRNPVILANVKSHYPFIDNNGWLIDDTDELEGIFSMIAKNKNNILNMSEKSFNIAKSLLDYKVLAQKIYDLNVI